VLVDVEPPVPVAGKPPVPPPGDEAGSEHPFATKTAAGTAKLKNHRVFRPSLFIARFRSFKLKTHTSAESAHI
jgi:hypothetical protein